jgi:hypothetical protein
VIGTPRVETPKIPHCDEQNRPPFPSTTEQNEVTRESIQSKLSISRTGLYKRGTCALGNDASVDQGLNVELECYE